MQSFDSMMKKSFIYLMFITYFTIQPNNCLGQLIKISLCKIINQLSFQKKQKIKEKKYCS